MLTYKYEIYTVNTKGVYTHIEYRDDEQEALELADKFKETERDLAYIDVLKFTLQ